MKKVCAALMLLATASCGLRSAAARARELARGRQPGEIALTDADKAVLGAPNETWKYVPFDGTQCRDGSPSGLYVRRNTSSRKLMVFMEGGGICFDARTCAINDANTDSQINTQFPTLDGLLDFANPANPAKDYNVVYVPYCSGDLHAGTRQNVQVPGVGVQQFVGRKNMLRFLRSIVKVVAAPTDVLLAGVSAGGLGAAMNMVPVQKAFDTAYGRSAPKVRLVNDAGPFVDQSSLAVCLQQAWRSLFGYDASFLADWPEGKRYASGEYLTQYAVWLAKSYADRASGLIETTRDEVITGFYGLGTNQCTGVLFATPAPGDVFEASLLKLRVALQRTRTGTYYLASDAHTFLESADFYAVSAGGQSLVDWFTRLMRDAGPGDAGP